MKIEHVALYVNDLEAAKDFFVRYFDAVPNAGYHNPRTDFRSYFLTFADGARLELMNKPGMPDEPKPAARTGYAHIAFSVGSREKVDALTARLKADGFEVLSGPRSGGRKSDRDHGVTQKSRACGENPQVSALFICISAQKHHDARYGQRDDEEHIFWAEYRTGAGKNYKKPKIHDENIVLVAQRPVKEMRKLKLFR